MGGSGCGKTNLLFNIALLLQKDWLDFNNIILCGKSLHQPEYQLLISSIEKGFSKQDTSKLFRSESGDIADFIQYLPQNRKNPLIILEVYDENSPVPDPCDIDNTF